MSSIRTFCRILPLILAFAIPSASFAEDGARGKITGPIWVRHAIDDFASGADGVRLADLNDDGRPDIATGWEEAGVTRVYLHPGKSKVKERWPAVAVGRTPSVEDAVLIDLDGDGRRDVISSCEGGTKTVFVHWGPKDSADLLVPSAWQSGPIKVSEKAGTWMFAVGMELDDRKGVELVVGPKGGGDMVWFRAGENPRDLAAYEKFVISPTGWIMSIRATDMDGDGDADLLISDRKGSHRACRWLENPGADSPDALVKPWKNHNVGAVGREVMFLTTGDVDRDGLEDVVAAVKPYDVMWFKRLDKTGDRWELRTLVYPENTGNAKGVAVGDVTGDGRPDLVISCEHAEGDKRGIVYLQQGKTPADKWIARELGGAAGIKYDRIELVDLDEDGDLDVLTCEENEGPGSRGLGVIWYENPTR